MATNRELAQMPIQDIVRQTGGNGLASPAFQFPLDILGVFGWQNIESGVEAYICDGELIPRTNARTDFARLIGRKSFVRRVLLKPAPLEVIATGLTQDELRLTLTLSIKYEVNDPIYVASVGDPLSELKNLFEGITTEYIRKSSFRSFYSDEGQVRSILQDRFKDAFIVKNKYIIHEILKVIPSGDESLIEIVRKTHAAIIEKDLIEAEGKNREVTATHDIAIARETAKLDDEIAMRNHVRDLEKKELEERSEIIKTAISSLGMVAQSGVDPSKLAKEVIGNLVEKGQNARLVVGREPNLLENHTNPQGDEKNQIEIEKRALDSIKEQIGITTYEIIESKSRIKGAIIQMTGYEIIFKCGDNYPQEKPEVTIRFSDGTRQTPGEYWITDISNILAQAVLAIIPQIKNKTDK